MESSITATTAAPGRSLEPDNNSSWSEASSRRTTARRGAMGGSAVPTTGHGRVDSSHHGPWRGDSSHHGPWRGDSSITHHGRVDSPHHGPWRGDSSHHGPWGGRQLPPRTMGGSTAPTTDHGRVDSPHHRPWEGRQFITWVNVGCVCQAAWRPLGELKLRVVGTAAHGIRYRVGRMGHVPPNIFTF